jgi:hypothetical protein
MKNTNVLSQNNFRNFVEVDVSLQSLVEISNKSRRIVVEV